MTPQDYFDAGKKHLNFCLDWKEKAVQPDYKAKEEEILEIFYLSGYAVECFVIYTIYRFGPWDPKGAKALGLKMFQIKREKLQSDIQEYFDPVFTHFTGFDFYKNSLINNKDKKDRRFCRKLVSVSPNDNITPDQNKQQFKDFQTNYVWKKIEDKYYSFSSPGDLLQCIDNTSKISPEELKAKETFVQGHDFQKNINDVINKNIRNMGLETIDFFNSYKKHKLIVEWKPEVRYYSSIQKWEEKTRCSEPLNKENLIEIIGLIDTYHQQISKL